MKFFTSAAVLSLGATLAAAADWSFQDASVSVVGKGAGGFKEQYAYPVHISNA